jgi:hypothetical protein
MLFLALVTLSFATACPALAQSPQELKAENERLKERVAELEEELEKAQRNIQLLSDEIKRLRTRGTSTPATTKEEKDETTTTEKTKQKIEIADDPFASPRAYVHHLRESYKEEFEDDEDFDPGNPSQKELRIVEIRSWISDQRRDFRGPIDWTVKLDNSEGRGVTGREAIFRFVHEPTGQSLGESFAVRMRRADLRRLAQADPETVYRLRALLSPTIRTAYDRPRDTDPGDGVFLGPFAELEMDFRIDSLREQ